MPIDSADMTTTYLARGPVLGVQFAVLSNPDFSLRVEESRQSLYWVEVKCRECSSIATAVYGARARCTSNPHSAAT